MFPVSKVISFITMIRLFIHRLKGHRYDWNSEGFIVPVIGEKD